MVFRHLLQPRDICIDATAKSKTAVLLKISQILSDAHPELNMEALFDAYWKRESLGSTTIGHGVMIPHIRSEVIQTMCSCLLKLQHPVDFGATDKQPVDIVLALVVPQHQIQEHLQILNQITKQFSIPAFRAACRKATECSTLYSLLTEDNLAQTEIV
ncbi:MULTISPECIES: PTS sugar transporter subunit IIA [Legionella]|uniref:PTS sugar transporter subunit IIA n=1 Tax=Legionella septentrionalis TaxID=2498109 RepID=A0A3S0V6G0_9GAMM|nr:MULTISPECIES: PTS sugar transporter subunit IIA [Legionella]MCP0914059.1 PTS sugar transporter subunit IIA [Legionella sp. 27cVA30]RUQ90779.1 PTS sugar transporter subunit IIA [Legionella septentrionalis]RUQ95011.1 PTS sugar transporter subunit IIA [Legionella septentrionalis]RUR09187.1 PTS sugar transporter subunit IIA [Legionella septentrionalis]RUR13952.1 PTS sugar transporter subunit IIA [Legionella septentrionalis]